MGLRENRDCKQGNGLLLAHDPQMVEELHVYCGREQQKRGTVLASVQQFVFGETLPRGHGHRGRISTLMSSLFDEITGRTPRKRRAIVTPTSRRCSSALTCSSSLEGAACPRSSLDVCSPALHS